MLKRLANLTLNAGCHMHEPLSRLCNWMRGCSSLQPLQLLDAVQPKRSLPADLSCLAHLKALLLRNSLRNSEPRLHMQLAQLSQLNPKTWLTACTWLDLRVARLANPVAEAAPAFAAMPALRHLALDAGNWQLWADAINGVRRRQLPDAPVVEMPDDATMLHAPWAHVAVQLPTAERNDLLGQQVSTWLPWWKRICSARVACRTWMKQTPHDHPTDGQTSEGRML